TVTFTLSLHDALPILSEWYPWYSAPKSSFTSSPRLSSRSVGEWCGSDALSPNATIDSNATSSAPARSIDQSSSRAISRSLTPSRSEEHTSELQSRGHL